MDMNRRMFLRRTAGAGGVLLCGCGLPGARVAAAGLQTPAGSGARQVVIGGKRVRTIDMHTHGYIDEVWPLIKDRNLRHLVATAGATQIVVGTDFDFDIAGHAPVDAVLQTPGLTPDEQLAILWGNAAKLLKLPA